MLRNIGELREIIDIHGARETLAARSQNGNFKTIKKYERSVFINCHKLSINALCNLNYCFNLNSSIVLHVL